MSDRMWWGLRACGCRSAWLYGKTHPSALVGDNAPSGVVVWVLTGEDVPLAVYHPTVNRRTHFPGGWVSGSPELDWSPGVCARTDPETFTALAVWVPPRDIEP